MQWGDICLKNDGNGDYYEFKERETKTRKGFGTNQHRAFAPKLFKNEENPARCPVRIMGLYASQRPDAMNEPNSPFYLGINHQHVMGSKWF